MINWTSNSYFTQSVHLNQQTREEFDENNGGEVGDENESEEEKMILNDNIFKLSEKWDDSISYSLSLRVEDITDTIINDRKTNTVDSSNNNQDNNNEINNNNQDNNNNNKTNTCQIILILHSNGIFPHPVLSFYYQIDYVLQNFIKYIQSI